ncbi:MAG: hypothetical protein HUJ51_02475 [Eggerthellaceae bacterium]|nr:hypothetical protein [Eggerthellaceae bacterium]
MQIQTLPHWFQLSCGELCSKARVIQFCVENMLRYGKIIAVATVTILVDLFFYACFQSNTSFGTRVVCLED